MTNRGYFGVGIYQPKTEMNVGTLWRSAHAFGADFIFTVGHRYRRQASDTTKAENHVPLFEYQTLADMVEHLPKGCQIVPVEVTGKIDLAYVRHPERAVYLLGPEDGSLPLDFVERYKTSISIATTYCLNVATAGSLVLYDRYAKALLTKQGVRGVEFAEVGAQLAVNQ